MFQTDSEWERSGSVIEVIRSLTGRPGLRQYPIVEVAPGGLVFQVEILFKGDDAGEGMGTRYFCAGVEAVLNFLYFEQTADIVVNLLAKKPRGNGYDFHAVKELRKIESDNTSQVFCVLASGKFYPKNITCKDIEKTVLLFRFRIR